MQGNRNRRVPPLQCGRTGSGFADLTAWVWKISRYLGNVSDKGSTDGWTIKYLTICA